MGAYPAGTAYLRAFYAKEKKFRGLQNKILTMALKPSVRNSPVLLYPNLALSGMTVINKPKN
jgi:hypothetical protein